jgi:hypothetical protein
MRRESRRRWSGRRFGVSAPLRDAAWGRLFSESHAELGASALPGTPAAGILEELDEVVRNSHRRSGLRRVLHGVGSAIAKRLSRIVPEAPPQSDLPRESDLPPEIWFPWH